MPPSTSCAACTRTDTGPPGSRPFTHPSDAPLEEMVSKPSRPSSPVQMIRPDRRSNFGAGTAGADGGAGTFGLVRGKVVASVEPEIANGAGERVGTAAIG